MSATSSDLAAANDAARRPAVLAEADGVFRVSVFSAEVCRRLLAQLEQNEHWRPALIERSDRSHGESPEVRSASLLPAAAAGACQRVVDDALLRRVGPLAAHLFEGELALTRVSFCRYPIGGFYRVHRDVSLEIAQRVLTVVLYLNDVEQGGETDFPDLAYAARPAAGTAIVFPSVYRHASLPVARGQKYAGVSWVETRGPSPWLPRAT